MQKKILCLVLFVLQIVLFDFLYAQNSPVKTVKEEYKVINNNIPLEVIIKIDAGELTVSKSKDSKTISLYMHYSRDNFRGRITFDEDNNRFRVELDHKGLFKSIGKGDKEIAELDLKLPDGIDILLDVKVKAGEIDMEMGGLRLKEFIVDNWAGEIEVNFNEPNPVKMDFMGIKTRAGELSCNKLGNSRFEKADINAGVGEIDIDFTGKLQNNSMAKVDLDIGESSILLPSDIGIKMIFSSWNFLTQKNIDSYFYRRGGSYYSEDYKNSSRKFYIKISTGIGELNVDSY